MIEGALLVFIPRNRCDVYWIKDRSSKRLWNNNIANIFSWIWYEYDKKTSLPWSNFNRSRAIALWYKIISLDLGGLPWTNCVIIYQLKGSYQGKIHILCTNM